MSETALLIAFIAFAFVVLILAVVARQLSVRDVFDDTSMSVPESTPALRDSFPASANTINPSVSSSRAKKNSGSNREKTHKTAKAISVIGAIILFTPTPESFKVAGMTMAFLGSMLAKATAPDKKKEQPKENPGTQKTRLLLSKSEYQGALKILNEDYKKDALVTEDDKYRHALHYLESKGIAPAEAKKNLVLLRNVVIQRK